MNSARTCFTVAAVVLAAGEARRMGRTKQILPLGKGTLVSHSVEVALDAGFAPVIVVVGAEAALVQAAVAAKPVEIAHNENWRTGMGSSIAAGIRQLQQLQAESAAVAILLTDQPLVTSDHLIRMKRLLVTSGAPAVAAEYNGTIGVPALFRRQLLPRLVALTGEGGAKPLLRDPGTVRFELPEAAIDIDTPADLPALDALQNSPESY